YKCDPTVAAFPCIGNVCYGTNVGGGGCGAGGCGASGCLPPVGKVIAGRPAAFPMPVMPPYQAPGTMIPTPMPAAALQEAVAPSPLPATMPVGLPQEATSQPPYAAPVMPMAPVAPEESPDAPPK